MPLGQHTIKTMATRKLEDALKKAVERNDTDRRTMLTSMCEVGELLTGLRERHLAGQLGQGSWAQYCQGKFGLTRGYVDACIAAYNAPDPDEWLRQRVEYEEQLDDRKNRLGKNSGFIVVKRPGVVFGYVTELDEVGKKELFALLWKNYPKLLRRVGDEISLYDGDEAEAHPS